MISEPLHCNAAGSRIFDSVVSCYRLSSYVAQGPPFWLRTLLAQEIFSAPSCLI